jgi:hypothetical protein
MLIYIPCGEYLVTGIIDENECRYDICYRIGRPIQNNQTALFRTFSKTSGGIYIYKIEHYKLLTLKSIRMETKNRIQPPTPTNIIRDNAKSCLAKDLNSQGLKLTEGEYCCATDEFYKIKELAYFKLLVSNSKSKTLIQCLKDEKFTGTVKRYEICSGALSTEHKLFRGYCNYSKYYSYSFYFRKEEEEVLISYWRMEEKVKCTYLYNGLGRLKNKSKYTGGVEIKYPPPNSHRLLPYLKEKDPYFRLWNRLNHHRIIV